MHLTCAFRTKKIVGYLLTASKFVGTLRLARISRTLC